MKKEILDHLPERKHDASEDADMEEDHLENEAVFANGSANGSVNVHAGATSADHEMKDPEGEQKQPEKITVADSGKTKGAINDGGKSAENGKKVHLEIVRRN